MLGIEIMLILCWNKGQRFLTGLQPQHIIATPPPSWWPMSQDNKLFLHIPNGLPPFQFWFYREAPKYHKLCTYRVHARCVFQFGEWCADHGKHGARVADTPFSLFEGLRFTFFFLLLYDAPHVVFLGISSSITRFHSFETLIRSAQRCPIYYFSFSNILIS